MVAVVVVVEYLWWSHSLGKPETETIVQDP